MGRTMDGSKPIFVINPKNEMYGKHLLDLALVADRSAADYDVQVILTCSPCDLYRISVATDHLFVFGQHIDPIASGPTTGKILPEGLQAAGAVGTMINHPESQLLFSDVQKSIVRAQACDLISLVFAQTLEQAVAVAWMNADMIMVEKPQFIASNTILDSSYLRQVTEAVHMVKNDMLVLQGAGIKSGMDVQQVIASGVQGTGSSSGIFKAENPRQMIIEMIAGARRGWDARTA
ncbi:MAG: triose-phosphate isomerase [Spirochaetae bacterium HGW-Spirochaetae-4]|nr:MAG: triose-phosphate isomerase [Spirochaetae bacterium HGW-Spirochaetae-8]PKL22279.1 MAG: triose-phosphate isomerase [Spirochaetae bacterium HGW-Spirochaetae-4]HCS35323.1 triose-phosphate isomerase [Sphaerochaeta sp.]